MGQNLHILQSVCRDLSAPPAESRNTGLHDDIIILWITATGCYFRVGDILTTIVSFDISQHLAWGCGNRLLKGSTNSYQEIKGRPTGKRGKCLYWENQMLLISLTACLHYMAEE